jgi:hypothetical protein
VEEQQHLFVGALEAAILSAQFHAGQGWTLRLQLRRQYEDWSDARTETYEQLSTDELVDVLDVSLGVFRAALGF